MNKCLNVEAPWFLDRLYEDHNFNIFAPVFIPKVNTNMGVKGAVYINNAGFYTIYGNMQSVDNNLSSKGDTCTNGVCDYMKGCTVGLETKNQILAHNILITSLDGDPSCGRDIFHDTSDHQQFEYKVENHQMLGASNINITSSVIDARVSVEVSVVKNNLSFYDNSSSVLLYVVECCQMSHNFSNIFDKSYPSNSISDSSDSDECYTSISAM